MNTTVKKASQVAFLFIFLGSFLGGCRVDQREISGNVSVTVTPGVLNPDLPTNNPADTPLPEVDPAVTAQFQNMTATPIVDQVTIAFTGVIVPARCVQAEVDIRDSADYIYAGVKEILESADITVGVYNATMRAGVPYAGCVRSWELVGSPINAEALQEAGFDLMSVATNHIKDCGFLSCGDEAFFETIGHLKRVGIKTVGAGSNLDDAVQPVVIEAGGIRFGFVSLGEVNDKVFAAKDSPGIAFLSRENLQGSIELAKEISDVIIVMPHSGPEDYPEVTPQQKYWARNAVAFGADLVVTTHAHVLQGYHHIEGVPVFYSLGNFVFDQSWTRDHQQGAILLITFEGSEIVKMEIIPTVVAQNGTVELATGAEMEEILNRIGELSLALETE